LTLSRPLLAFLIIYSIALKPGFRPYILPGRGIGS
jgi:hypothetical protein